MAVPTALVAALPLPTYETREVHCGHSAACLLPCCFVVTFQGSIFVVTFQGSRAGEDGEITWAVCSSSLGWLLHRCSTVLESLGSRTPVTSELGLSAWQCTTQHLAVAAVALRKRGLL